MSLGEILAIASTGLSFIDRLLGYSSEKKAREEILKRLQQAKISEEEKRALLNELDRSYNTATINEMNSAALGLSGILNQDTYRGLMASKVLGQKASDRLKLIQQIDQHNRNIDLEQAQVPLPSPVNLSSLLNSAVQGLILGNLLEESFKNRNMSASNTSIASNTPSTSNVSLNNNVTTQNQNSVGTTLPSVTKFGEAVNNLMYLNPNFKNFFLTGMTDDRIFPDTRGFHNLLNLRNLLELTK